MIVGATHAARLADALSSMGGEVLVASIPNWRATGPQVKLLAEQVEGLLQTEGYTEAVLVIQALDKNIFMGRCEDGTLVPPRTSTGATT